MLTKIPKVITSDDIIKPKFRIEQCDDIVDTIIEEIIMET